MNNKNFDNIKVPENLYKFIDDNTFVGVEKYNLALLGRDSGKIIETPDNF